MRDFFGFQCNVPATRFTIFVVPGTEHLLRRPTQGAYPYVAKQILNENKPEMVSLMKTTLITPEGTIAWRRLEQLVSPWCVEIAAQASNGRSTLYASDCMVQRSKSVWFYRRMVV